MNIDVLSSSNIAVTTKVLHDMTNVVNVSSVPIIWGLEFLIVGMLAQVFSENEWFSLYHSWQVQVFHVDQPSKHVYSNRRCRRFLWSEIDIWSEIDRPCIENTKFSLLENGLKESNRMVVG